MDVYILTQPLGKNFGGLMQAVNLREELLRIGYRNVFILNVDYIQSRSQRLKNFVVKLLQLNQLPPKPLYDYSNLENEVKELEYVIHLHSYKDIVKLKKVDLLVIGSDQVWRKNYSPNLWTYYGWKLHRVATHRISYAASFGVNYLESYSLIDKIVIKRLLVKIDALSVREESGARLLLQNFCQSSVVSLDPAFFFSRRRLFLDNKTMVSHDISSYILDRANLLKFRSLCVDTIDLSEYIASPTMNDWLNWFCNSNFLVTDSYHGVIMSIVFKKPFVVIPNEGRGRARFETLLKRLRLENRVLENFSQFQNIKFQHIDYEYVYNILAQELDFSREYLSKYLVK